MIPRNIDGLSSDPRNHAYRTFMREYRIQMLSHILLDMFWRYSAVHNHQQWVMFFLFDVFYWHLRIIHLYFEFVRWLFFEEILQGYQYLCWARPSSHYFALHAYFIETKQCRSRRRELLYNLRVVFLRLTSFQSLRKHHLTHAYHTAPTNIPKLVLLIIPIRNPYHTMKIIHKQFPIFIPIHSPEQHSRLTPLLQYNLLPVNKRTGRMFYIV